MRRAKLALDDAPNDGCLRLRLIARRSTFRRLAKKLMLDESGVRRWAHGSRLPGFDARARMEKLLEIPIESWDEPPKSATSLVGAG